VHNGTSPGSPPLTHPSIPNGKDRPPIRTASQARSTCGLPPYGPQPCTTRQPNAPQVLAIRWGVHSDTQHSVLQAQLHPTWGGNPRTVRTTFALVTQGSDNARALDTRSSKHRHRSSVDPRGPLRGRRGRRSDPSGDPNTSTWERQVTSRPWFCRLP
jgi:hypothetical protein